MTRDERVRAPVGRVMCVCASLFIGMASGSHADQNTVATEKNASAGNLGLAGSVEHGSELAKTRCGRCHAIGKTDKSPLIIAPPLRDFVKKWPLETLEEALGEGIVTGHADMPVFVFTPAEIVGFIDYLESLGRAPE